VKEKFLSANRIIKTKDSPFLKTTLIPKIKIKTNYVNIIAITETIIIIIIIILAPQSLCKYKFLVKN
jgi:hypothetical protein